MQDTTPQAKISGPPRCTLVKASHRSRRGQEIARNVLAFFILAIALYTIRGFMPALMWGCVFAVATWPLYTRAQLFWPKAAKGLLLPFLFTAAMTLIFVIPLLLITLEAVGEAQSALNWLEKARQSGVPLPEAISHLPFGRQTLTQWWQAHLANPKDVSGLVGALDSKGMAVTKAVGAQVAHRGTLFCFSIVTLFFLYKDGSSVVHQCRIASRRAFGRRGEIVARQIVASIHGTVQGLVLVGIAEGVLMGFVYFLCGAPHPALFGVITGVAAMIPFCAMIAIGFVSLLILAQGASMAGIIAFCIGAIVIFVADHFIRPVLIGGSTKLPFLWVLLGILGGAETWGLLGLFVGPAAMAALDLVWRRWTVASSRRQNQIES